MKNKEKIFLLILLIFLFAINYPIFNSLVINAFGEESEGVFVERVIDGDTIKTNMGNVRLLGINCPERGEEFYEDAKKYLEDRILNKTVELRFGKEDKDKYGRILAYVFIEGENVDIEIVEKGYANYYFPSGKDNYYGNFRKAWERCIEKNINLCEDSKAVCADCIKLEEFDFAKEIVVLKNSCGFSCDLNGWTIKDEGRKKRVLNFSIGNYGQEEIVFENVWTSTGDSLFLRDKEGGLVLWESY